MLRDGTRVIDIIPFFDEVDLLEIRLEVLSEIVDLFIISEFSTSFSGEKKGYNFEKYRSRFAKFEHKIIYKAKSHTPDSDSFKNDHFQKNSLNNEVSEYVTNDDLILFGDLDEIPNPRVLAKAHKYIMNGTPLVHFAQIPFYGFLNMKDTSGKLLSYAGDYPHILRKKWLGTIATNKKLVLSQTMTQLRDPSFKENGKRLRNGGWHFSYCGGMSSSFEQRVRYKIINNAHQEFNNEDVLGRIEERRDNQEDFLGRKYRTRFGQWTSPKFKPVKFSNSFPEYIRLHSCKYPHLVYDRH